MSKTVLISGASSGFGALTARALADAGHIVYAGMRDVAGRNATAAADAKQVSQKLAELEPAWADVAEVAEAIVTVVGTEKGRRPFRVHIDPSDDGAAVVNGVADRVRAELLRRIGLDDLLHPVAG
jgi:NAD(P)-dependent dehydrogenase (short-subunit alcohol dehydrogenase family)